MLKYFNNRNRKGQSTLEYAILVIVIIGALLAIQVYIKRGIQGRLKSATDDIGDQFSVGNQKLDRTETVTHATNETFNAGVSKTNLNNEATTIAENSTVVNVNQEFWG